MTRLPQADPDDARRLAEEILAESRFDPPPIPRPFKGLLETLGDWLRPVGDFISDVIAWIAGWLPGGDAIAWSVLGGSVVAIAAAVALWLGRRRAHASQPRFFGDRFRAPADPEALERRADEAEERGELEAAVRMRFKAGLLRLDALRTITFRESLTSREVARRLRSATFEELARSFDEIVYGGRSATRTDARAARDGWKRVITEAAGT